MEIRTVVKQMVIIFYVYNSGAIYNEYNNIKSISITSKQELNQTQTQEKKETSTSANTNSRNNTMTTNTNEFATFETIMDLNKPFTISTGSSHIPNNVCPKARKLSVAACCK